MPVVGDSIEKSKDTVRLKGAESMADCSMFVEDGLAA